MRMVLPVLNALAIGWLLGVEEVEHLLGVIKKEHRVLVGVALSAGDNHRHGPLGAICC